MRPLPALIFLLAASACGDPAPSAVDTSTPREAEPEATAAPARLRRLTADQYHAAARSLLGEGLSMPSVLEPDGDAHGFASAGAAVDAVSSLGVERYEDAAYFLADQRIADMGPLFERLPCEPEGSGDVACAEASLEVLARRAFRRVPTPDEVSALSSVWADVAAAEGVDQGWRYALAALLQSPSFLYRVEVGVDGWLDGFEWATRTSFLLWGEPPDDELLAAAAEGRLDTAEGRAEAAERLLDDPRLAQGVRAFVTEWFHLHELEQIDKDPLLFPHATAGLGPAAKEETLLLAVELGIGDYDFRDLLTASFSFVDPRLAALYEVPAPSLDGFARVELPPERRGILGHASTLAVHSHATRTSATGRGLFVRSTLLCQSVPEPPADVDTSLPEPDTTSPTLRDRLVTHLEDPNCSVCHLLTDPIGLGLENFDAVGHWRDTEKGAPIDASGELDGAAFTDAVELGQVIRESPTLPLCWTEQMWIYATGGLPVSFASTDWLADGLARDDYRLRTLLREAVLSDAFRRVEVQ
jgi:hypothetical protein